MDDNGSSSKIEQKESVRIDVVKSEDNSIKILKSGSKSDVNNKPNKAEESLSQAKFDIIEYYEKMTAEIDIHTEKLLLSLPEALEEGREELLKMLQQEKERCLAALGPESAVVRHKNEYYQLFLQLKEEYTNLGTSDEKRREEIHLQLEELKNKVQVLEEFLEDFGNRTLSFEEADSSVYEALIGELVLTENKFGEVDLKLNDVLAP